MLSQGLLKRKESEMYEYEYVMGRTDSRQAAANSCVLNSASPLKHDNNNTRYKGLLFNEALVYLTLPSMARYLNHDCIKSEAAQHRGQPLLLTACLPYTRMSTLKLRSVCTSSVEINQNPLRTRKHPDLVILSVCETTREWSLKGLLTSE